MKGPGKYADMCEGVRIQTQARAVVVIVGGGIHGDGFSVAGESWFLASLPQVLRSIADEIEKDMSS